VPRTASESLVSSGGSGRSLHTPHHCSIGPEDGPHRTNRPACAKELVLLLVIFHLVAVATNLLRKKDD